ncbi:MAG: transcriptional repressor [Paludibacteraceae bacterium]|nr:transcriptional repressor [Paludibacteraceae bacterium]
MKAREKLERYLKEHELRQTMERSAMLDFIIRLDGHFSISTLLEYFAPTNHISKMSVYRNLDLFLKADIVVMHPFPGDMVMYELAERAETHYHRICTQCGAVKEFHDTKTSKLLKSHRFKGFTMTTNQVYIYGICSKCKKKI